LEGTGRISAGGDWGGDKMSRDINQCVPALRTAWEKVKNEVLQEFGITIKLSYTSRTEIEQVVFFLNDKLPVDLVNDVRKSFGMQPTINHGELTKTLCSKHLTSRNQPLSRALDFYIEKDGKPDWDDIDAYKKVGRWFENYGFSCLDEIHDYGHVEVR